MLDTTDSMAIDPPPNTPHQPSQVQPDHSMPPPSIPNALRPSGSGLSAQSATLVDGPVGSRIASGSENSNSEAGPSHLPFYVQKHRSGPPAVRLHINQTQDLIGRLGLLPAFDSLVRPYIRPTPELSEKGKGKEVDMSPEAPEGQNGIEKKKEHEKGWRSFATAVPSKFSTKKDTYLGDLVQYIEAKPRIEITRFDYATLKSFRLEEGQLPPDVMQQLGMGPESEKKKLKKKKKTPQEALFTASPSAASPPAASSSQTPRPGGAPNTPLPGPGVHKAWMNRPQTNRPPTIAQTVPSDYTRVPVDGNHWAGVVVPPELSGGLSGLPMGHVFIPNTNNPTNTHNKAAKVRKERDESGGPSASNGVNGVQGAQNQASGAGGQPRPHKKRKTDGSPGATSQHHGLPPHPQQQPMQQATPTF